MGRRYSKIAQRRCRDHPLQPHSRPALDVNRQAADRLAVKETLRGPVPESIGHLPILTPRANTINRPAVTDPGIPSPHQPSP